jgi:hypothetical protein
MTVFLGRIIPFVLVLLLRIRHDHQERATPTMQEIVRPQSMPIVLTHAYYHTMVEVIHRGLCTEDAFA